VAIFPSVFEAKKKLGGMNYEFQEICAIELV